VVAITFELNLST